MPDRSTHVNPWIVTIAVMLATFMEVLDTTVVNVSIPHMAGNMGATVRRRYVGGHVVPGVERHHSAHGGLAGLALRAPPHADGLRQRIHPDLAAVRHGDQPRLADLLPHSARPEWRRPAAAVAVGAAGNVPAEEAWHGDGGVRPGHHHRAHPGPDARRLDHRQLHLALDLLHQPAGRAFCRC